jgi:hypothetical protein
MNIEQLRTQMQLLGLSEDQFNELAGIASDLPRTKVSGQVAGLTEVETSVLLSHVLRQAASSMGVHCFLPM